MVPHEGTRPSSSAGAATCCRYAAATSGRAGPSVRQPRDRLVDQHRDRAPGWRQHRPDRGLPRRRPRRGGAGVPRGDPHQSRGRPARAANRQGLAAATVPGRGKSPHGAAILVVGHSGSEWWTLPGIVRSCWNATASTGQAQLRSSSKHRQTRSRRAVRLANPRPPGKPPQQIRSRAAAAGSGSPSLRQQAARLWRGGEQFAW